jgi:hypothetical protein
MLPGGVTPPIGTLPPPNGITPMLPGGVTPPIATLPPNGITPTLPGGVTPPVGTLPPNGITPTLPGGVMPPVPTLPPNGVTPTPPGGAVTPPGVAPQPGAGVRTATDGVVPSGVDCIDPGQAQTAPPGDRAGRPLCSDPRLRMSEVPLTPGRDLGTQGLWNWWMEATYVSSSDSRAPLDTTGDVGTITFGLDRRLGAATVAGFMVSLDVGSTSSGDALRSNSTGFTLGPYLAFRLSEHWAVDASLSYGQLWIDQQIAFLNGSYISRVYSGSTNLHGQYQIGQFILRPRLSLNYAHVANDAFGVAGLLLGTPLDVRVPGSSYNLGTTDAYGEVSRIFTLSNGLRMMPYAEFGAHYAFERPFDGRLLGDLSDETPSRWTFSIRSGVRAAWSDSVLLEASAGYLSLAQNGLNVWEGRIRASIAF